MASAAEEYADMFKSQRDIAIEGGVKIGTNEKNIFNIFYQGAPLSTESSILPLLQPTWSRISNTGEPRSTISKLMQTTWKYLQNPWGRQTNAVPEHDIANAQLIREEALPTNMIIDDGENFLQLLQMKLQETYRNRHLPYPSFLGCDPNVAIHGGYVDPLMKCKKTGERILLRKIFENQERHRVTVLSIEADPGNGKSALAQKLINDWSRKREYINHFHLVFLLDGDIKSKNIKAAISDIIKDAVSDTIQEVESENILKNKDIKILLIFDELDEDSDILTTSFNRNYSHITKIVTCKRDSQLKPNVPHWSIVLLGILSDFNEDFLLNFKTRDQVEKMLRFCENNATTVADDLHVSSPLHLVVLSTLSEGISFLTETQVFIKLFNTVAQIRLQKMGKPFEKNFDLFSLSDPHETIQILGELSFKKLKARSLHFDKNSATEKLYSLGLLTQEGHHHVAYGFNFLELLAAFFVAVTYKSTKNQSQLIENVSNCFDLREYSLFISFLVRFLQEDAIDLFSQNSCISPWLAINDDNLFLILSNYEGEYLKRVIKATEKSIPPHVQVNSEYFQKLPIATQRKLLKVGLKKKRITLISITNKEKSLILENLPMTKVKLIVTIFPHQNPYNLNQLKKIRCKKLVFEFVDGDRDKNLWINFSLFSSISARIYELRLLGPKVHEELNFCISLRFLVKSIHHLQTTLTVQAETYPVKTLIQNEQVQSIKLDKHLNVDLNDILVAIAESNKTKSLDLTYSTLTEENSIDLTELTKNGRKKYTNLRFTNCRLTCQQDLTTRKCFDFIAIKDRVEENTLILTATNPRKLQCAANMMIHLGSSWIGYKSLQRLTLQVDEHDPKLWDWLKSCSSMKTLVLLFEEHKLPREEAIPIVECIKHIGVKHLSVGQFVGHDSVESLINCFNALNVSSVEILDVYIHIRFGKCYRCPPAIDSALNAIHDNHVKIVNVFCHQEAVRRHVLGNDILGGLRVSHQVEEVCESHWKELGTNIKCLSYFKIEKPSRLNLFN